MDRNRPLSLPRPTWLTAVSAGLVALLTVGLMAVPTAALADDVQVAEARVAALQDLARTTTTRLEEGTRRWEADQAKLQQARVDLENTRRRIQQAEGQIAAGQARVDTIARRTFMYPAPRALHLAVTQEPDKILDTLQLQGALNIVAGSDRQIILRAQTAKIRQQQREQTAQQLTEAVQKLTDQSAAQLRELKALAGSTASQLDAAEQQLQTARAERARRQAAARAAALAEAQLLARAQAARDAARRAAQEAARKAKEAPVYRGGPACTGRSTEGQSNGNLDPASLCPLWMAPGHRLRGDAAEAFNRMSKHHAATVGGPLCVTDSYRSYSEQVSVYQRKPGLAAVPGRSEHGWGKAVDFCGGVQNFGTDAYNWMKANAGRFGWFHPDWAEPSGSRPEAWHWEFNG